MARVLIGTTPVQVLAPSTKRSKWEVQVFPSSIVAANTGLVYLATGNPPRADIEAQSYDEVLSAGAAIERSMEAGDGEDEVGAAVWLVSDTAGQVVNVTEQLLDAE